MKPPADNRPFPKGQVGFREAAYRLIQVSALAQILKMLVTFLFSKKRIKLSIFSFFEDGNIFVVRASSYREKARIFS